MKRATLTLVFPPLIQNHFKFGSSVKRVRAHVMAGQGSRSLALPNLLQRHFGVATVWHTPEYLWWLRLPIKWACRGFRLSDVGFSSFALSVAALQVIPDCFSLFLFHTTSHLPSARCYCWWESGSYSASAANWSWTFSPAVFCLPADRNLEPAEYATTFIPPQKPELQQPGGIAPGSPCRAAPHGASLMTGGAASSRSGRETTGTKKPHRNPARGGRGRGWSRGWGWSWGWCRGWSRGRAGRGPRPEAGELARPAPAAWGAAALLQPLRPRDGRSRCGGAEQGAGPRAGAGHGGPSAGGRERPEPGSAPRAAALGAGRAGLCRAVPNLAQPCPAGGSGCGAPGALPDGGTALVRTATQEKSK